MLTRLRFQNWRSLRDVEINDLTPITVFVGANASGKSNTVDALRFLRYVNTKGHGGVIGGVSKWGGREKIRAFGVGEDATISLEFSFRPRAGEKEVTSTITLKFAGRDIPLTYGSEYFEDKIRFDKFGPYELPISTPIVEGWFSESENAAHYELLKHYAEKFITRRWQLLDEGFMPKLSVAAGASPGNLPLLESDAGNLVFVLDYMRQVNPTLYGELVDDLRWLLDYVDGVNIQRRETDTRLTITEIPLNKQEAPSISAGTARLMAMLAAFYVLDMEMELVDMRQKPDFEGLNVPIAHMPGLVVIEEPDTALNPALLGRFVELLRGYVAGEFPRQVILTTHNPALLNFFRPEEVRVVERDKNGHTTIHKIPEHIEKIWLDEYGLGEVWLTNSFGGLAE